MIQSMIQDKIHSLIHNTINPVVPVLARRATGIKFRITVISGVALDYTGRGAVSTFQAVALATGNSLSRNSMYVYSTW